MLVTVIIFLREALEAALIFSVLLAVASQLRLGRYWFYAGSFAGLIGALLTAYFLDDVTDVLDGTGQEVMNAGFLLCMICMNSLVCIYLARFFQRHTVFPSSTNLFPLGLCFLILVMVAITHEGSELALYSYAFIQTQEDRVGLFLGGALGIGIGASLGAIIYYILRNLSCRLQLKMAIAVLLLIAAGMTSQATLYLVQSGWLPASKAMWDTSDYLPETSLLGQLLYALIGYEATPDLLQVALYFSVILCNLILIYIFSRRQEKNNAGQGYA